MKEAMAQADTRPDLYQPTSTEDRPLELNYALMRGAMFQWVQTLSGDRWTNYNESDPGVTILEHLCFALTELGLRADQSIPALLASTQSLRMQLQRQGLYAAQDILPGPALTLLDQRRWLLDQISHAANIWLYPIQDGPCGLVRAEVLPRLPDLGSCLCPSEEEDLRQELVDEVRHCAARSRNLGEDLDAVVVLLPQPLTLTAKLNISPQRHPDEILAEILYRLGVFLAPEPRRHSLETRITAGLTTAEIYEGPPMQRGFIADEELMPVIQAPSARALKEVMASVKGVLEVEELSIAMEGGSDPGIKTSDDDSLNLKRGCFPRIQVDLSAKSLPLKLYRDAHFVDCNPERVQRLLNRWWQDHRQSFNLDQSYQQVFPLPEAINVEDGSYVSVQTLFPSVYRLLATSLDASSTPKQQGQIKQLKGYLMIFDQLMADFASQLAFLRDLFSPLAGGDQTYAWRSLCDVDGCAADLLISDYEARQAALHQRSDPKAQRQATILDFFLTLYGQSLLPLSPGHSQSSPQLLQAKKELLRDVVALSRERGSGLNHLDIDHLAAPTALERRCAMELRVRRPSGRSGTVTVETVAKKATFGRLLSAEAARKVRESYLSLDGLMAPLALPVEGDGLANPLGGRTVADVLWRALAKPKSYRIGGCDVGEDVDLVCLDDCGSCWWLGSFAHARLAHAYAHQLINLAGAQTDAVYIIEWLLLRHARYPDSRQSLPSALFNSRVSIVLMRDRPIPTESELTASLLRPHVPAHLDIQVHVYGPRRFSRFLALREAWLRSLSGEDVNREANAYRLVSFLLDGAIPPPPPAVASARAAPPTASGSASSPSVEGEITADPPPAEPIPLLSPPAISSDLALKMIVTPATVDAEGAWCDDPVEMPSLRQWRTAGLSFLMRPLPWTSSPGGALDGEELTTLLRLGFAVMPFQDPSSTADVSLPEPSPAGFSPMAELGRLHGQVALQAAQRLQMGQGMVIWLAGYPANAPGDPESRMLYINSWSQAVGDGGFGSGLLLTRDTPLTNLRCDWLGGGDPSVFPPMLGFGLIRDTASEQRPLLAGQGEILRIQKDRRNSTPQWLALDPRALPPNPP